MNGIDVSHHQGNIDWQSVKASGKVDFCIIRAGYGKSISQKDAKFEQNYAGCKAQGIPVGAYWYSYAITPAEAEAEARTFLQAIAGKQFEMPVYFDIEEKKALATGKNNVSAIVKAFCNVMEKAGYWCGVYASRAHVQSYFDNEVKNRYSLWLAEWGTKLNYSGGEVGMWQYSDKGKINGIGGSVDMDICYVDYPTVIPAAGKNGYTKPTEDAAQAPDMPVEPPVKDTVKVTITIDGKPYSGFLAAVE
jgi:GH25 family lysozyme M1 (1,4-beta-N-acetylmuramidase)